LGSEVEIGGRKAVEKDAGASLLDANVDTAGESVVHAMKGNEQTRRVDDSNVLWEDVAGYLDGGSDDTLGLVGSDVVSL
jgi:hypothetical protein